jgi:hypothetical protein
VVIAAGACPHIGCAGDEGDTECVGDFFHEAGIVAGFSARAQHVVEVGDGEVDLKLRAKPGEDNEKGGRVGSAGDANEDMLAGGENPRPADMGQYAPLQGGSEAGGDESCGVIFRFE